MVLDAVDAGRGAVSGVRIAGYDIRAVNQLALLNTVDNLIGDIDVDVRPADAVVLGLGGFLEVVVRLTLDRLARGQLLDQLLGLEVAVDDVAEGAAGDRELAVGRGADGAGDADRVELRLELVGDILIHLFLAHLDVQMLDTADELVDLLALDLDGGRAVVNRDRGAHDLVQLRLRRGDLLAVCGDLRVCIQLGDLDLAVRRADCLGYRVHQRVLVDLRADDLRNDLIDAVLVLDVRVRRRRRGLFVHAGERADGLSELGSAVIQLDALDLNLIGERLREPERRILLLECGLQDIRLLAVLAVKQILRVDVSRRDRVLGVLSVLGDRHDVRIRQRGERFLRLCDILILDRKAAGCRTRIEVRAVKRKSAEVDGEDHNNDSHQYANLNFFLCFHDFVPLSGRLLILFLISYTFYCLGRMASELKSIRL